MSETQRQKLWEKAHQNRIFECQCGACFCAECGRSLMGVGKSMFCELVEDEELVNVICPDCIETHITMCKLTY